MKNTEGKSDADEQKKSEDKIKNEDRQHSELSAGPKDKCTQCGKGISYIQNLKDHKKS